MPSDRRLRAFDPADLDRIGEITAAAWEPIYEGYRATLGEKLFRAKYGDDWRTDKATRVKDQCRNNPGRVRVIEVDGDVVGFVTFSIDTETGIGKIGNNAIAPAWQGQGLGTWIYEQVLDRFQDRGLDFATVGTGLDAAHAPARRPYEEVGFDIERRSVTYYQELSR